MAYFPMCVDLTGREALLVGNGAQIGFKAEKLRHFGVRLVIRDFFHPEDLTGNTAFVVVGDTDAAESARISGICNAMKMPVNVVDRPELSTFFFPATVTRGELTVSVSTGGRTPGAAAYLARRISADLPDRTEEILDWLSAVRQRLYSGYPREKAKRLMAYLTEASFALGRPLTDTEMDDAVL